MLKIAYILRALGMWMGFAMDTNNSANNSLVHLILSTHKNSFQCNINKLFETYSCGGFKLKDYILFKP